MNAHIGLENYCVSCIIGDLPNEREEEQNLYIDLYVDADIAKCIISDHVHDTIDYVRLGIICEEVSKNHYHMLESYAYHVLKTILNELPVKSAHIKVTKPAAFQNACKAFVELSMSKET